MLALSSLTVGARAQAVPKDVQQQPLPGATDIIYWVNEEYTGLKPVISLVHGVTYADPAQPDRTVIALKQLYASHYYDGSLALALAIDAADAGAPATYLI